MPPAREPTAVPAPSGAEPVPHSTLPSPTTELPVRTARPLRPVASVLVAAVLLVGCTDAPRATLDDPRVDTEPPVAVEPAPDDAVCDQEERATLVAAVDGQVDVILDGGVRRGTDVVKALALGARAVSVGRPYVWGLAADGRAGVARVLEILRAEIDRTLALIGCASVSDVGPEHLFQPGDHVRPARSAGPETR